MGHTDEQTYRTHGRQPNAYVMFARREQRNKCVNYVFVFVINFCLIYRNPRKRLHSRWKLNEEIKQKIVRLLTECKNGQSMSSFHFHCWNQLKLIPLPSTLHTRTFLPPNVSLLIIGCVLRTMRYICNHQVAPLTICISKWELLGVFRLQLKTVTVQKITLITDNL